MILEIRVAWEKRRSIPDFDNCIVMMKGVIDGVTEAGFMENDRQVIGIYLRQRKDPDGLGYIDLTARPANAVEIAWNTSDT